MDEGRFPREDGEISRKEGVCSEAVEDGQGSTEIRIELQEQSKPLAQNILKS